jgi:hypothetical protein
MNKRWMKLAFVLGVLAGGAVGVMPLQQAEAGPYCPSPICEWPDDCTCVLRCYFDATLRRCVCDEICPE